MTIKTSIGWCNMTINPVKGLCQGGCWYCYYSGKRGFARRFKHNPQLRLDLSVFDNLPKHPKKIFLCSTNDYWGDWISDKWRQAIRLKTQEYPQHIFQILTKEPQNIKHYYSPNWWVGVTATNPQEYIRATHYLEETEARVKFISFEPLLERTLASLYRIAVVQWVIIGRLTGFGHKYDPKVIWIDEIIRACADACVPVFLKDNLKCLLGDNLVQEFPEKREERRIHATQ